MVNSAVRYYICDFSIEGEYLGRTEFKGIEDIIGEVSINSCEKEGEYAYLDGSYLVKLTDGYATCILTNGKNNSAVFTQDRLVQYYSFGTEFFVYNIKTAVSYQYNLKNEIADFDTDDFFNLDITDIGNGELLLGINEWKNQNEYYILSNY
jgi:hypothetical protein